MYPARHTRHSMIVLHYVAHQARLSAGGSGDVLVRQLDIEAKPTAILLDEYDVCSAVIVIAQFVKENVEHIHGIPNEFAPPHYAIV